ncbi:C-terminal processing protease CtpA/Prc [Fluviicoccus keumensis]|uniref:C-terminal processing protease CtpA/Prc n=1 Tax=Fluviicoccus keumensis TaxID=1435465 RepID=A0A4Q7YN97_9GAMM|nr:S41 family peptidase [Fluviicoccus keumensis]RZU38333.1 C-terminal processing protease CtpA/Prc [Fluviicoccus keumensis]
MRMPEGKGRWAVTTALALALSACGGGDGVDGGEVCTPAAEKAWAHAHLDDVYLWYKDIIDVPPTNYKRVEDYFSALLVKPRDRFSFVTGKAAFDAFHETGASVDYGVLWSYDPSLGNALRAEFIEPGSPADAGGVHRGDILVGVNGVSIGYIPNRELVRSLNPLPRERVELILNDRSGLNFRYVTLYASEFIHQPVPRVSVLNRPDGSRVGYVLFNDHIRTATDGLAKAIAQLKAAGVSDVVLDLRYNGGGYLSVASQLAYMLSGPNTSGQVFGRLSYNDKHTAENSVVPFIPYDNQGVDLPRLNLNRVYVLTDSRTCSASESVINGLRPFMNVVLVGASTCGKPYGFRQTDYCDKAYFAVRLKMANQSGDSVPETGFTMDCPVRDDLQTPLGDEHEPLLSAALTMQANGSCPNAAAARMRSPTTAPPPMPLPRNPWRENLLDR